MAGHAAAATEAGDGRMPAMVRERGAGAPARPLRLLYVRDTLMVCGPGKTIVNTWRTMDRERFALTVASTRPTGAATNGLLDALQRLDARTEPLAIGRGVDLAAVWRLVGMIRRHRIDILQTHDAQTRRLGVIAAALTGVRHITSVHGWIFNDEKQRAAKWLDARLIGAADHVIAVSDRLRQDLEAAGVDGHKITVLRNAIVLADYQTLPPAAPLAAAFGIPAGHRVVSIIGRLSAEKGHEVFLQAARTLLASDPALTFLIVGDGPLRSRLETVARELGIAGNVVFTGHRSAMADVYAVTDVLAISSFTEGIPNVLLEAFAFGRPAVATDVGGVGEVLRNGEGGWLIPAGSADALAEGLQRLLRDPEERQRMGVAGRERIARFFSFEERTRAIERIYSRFAQELVKATPQ